MPSRKRPNPPKSAVSAVNPQAGHAQIQIQSKQFSGPLPPPHLLADYERIIPGAAERIFASFESETAHRHAIEQKNADLEVESVREFFHEGRRGQWFALIIALTAIGAGSFVAWHGEQIAGGILGSLGVASIVSSFIWGRWKSGPGQPDTKRDE
jgi:uncharacterized membrane protein